MRPHGSRLASLTLAVGLALAGCAGPPHPAPRHPVTSPVAGSAPQVLVDDLVRHARAGDRSAFDALISAADPSFPDRALLLYDNLARLPWGDVRIELQPPTRAVSGARARRLGRDAWQQPATVRWRLEGESATAQHTVWLTFVRDGERPRLAGTTTSADDGDPPLAQPVWWTGSVSAATRAGVTVLVGSGQRAGTWLDRATAAAAEVRRRVSAGPAAEWDGRLVVEIAGSRPAFEAVLGAEPGSYADIAAVALREGPGPEAALRVLVNPAVTRTLAPLGVAVVLTHETVHVATRSPGSPAPTWIVEGLADEVALSAHPDVADGVTEPLLQRVRSRGAPTELPADEAFRAGADDLAVSYAAAWTACRYVTSTWSAEDLQRLYTALDDGRDLDEALAGTLGTDEARFTAGWRADLEQRARS